MKQSNKIIKAFGIEFQQLSRKDKETYMAVVAKARPDLSSFDNYTECYELNDGSILEIFAYDVPKESVLRLFKSEKDYKQVGITVAANAQKLAKYNGKTTFEIINFKQTEIYSIEKTHNRILADSLKIDISNLDYSKESLKFLDKSFMRITSSDEYDDNLVYKSLLYYLAVMLNSYLTESEIKFEIQDNVIQRINVIDREKKSYNADIGIFEIWTEGPVVTMEFNEAGKKKKGKLTLEILFDVEIGKYKHSFKSKPSNILEY